MNRVLNLVLPLLTAVIFVTGCDKSAKPLELPKPESKKADAITPARETSFVEVTSQLDPGGTVFAYLATDQWLAGLSTNVAGLRDLLDVVPDMPAKDREQADRALKMITSLVRKSGAEELTGVGLSGVQVTPELYRTKFIMHHREGEGDGLLWNLMGRKPHALAGLNLLSTNTAMASFSDLDAKLLWEMIESECRASGIPELANGVQQWPVMFEQQAKLPWQKVLESLGGEVGIVITLNPSQTISLPVGGAGMEIPEPGLMLVMKVNDDLLYNRATEELKKTKMAKFTEEQDLKMCVIPVPIPVPLDLQITVAQGGGYLFIASSPTLVRDALAVKSGAQPGLAKSPEFLALMKYLPSEGNNFTYVDRRVSEAVANIQKQSMNSGEMNAGQKKILEKYLFNRPPAYGLTISAHTATGWVGTSIGNQDASMSLVAAPAVAVGAMSAAMILPALAKAKEKAQSINCMNNMKQQGLAFRIWAGDNGDKFPFNVSREKGGTLEYCDRGSDGFDLNSFRHFQVMSNELATPKILVCPGDKGKTAAINFGALQAANVSYRVRSGEKVDEINPQEVLIECPIHHHKCMVVGSVQAGKRTEW